MNEPSLYRNALETVKSLSFSAKREKTRKQAWIILYLVFEQMKIKLDTLMTFQKFVLHNTEHDFSTIHGKWPDDQASLKTGNHHVTILNLNCENSKFKGVIHHFEPFFFLLYCTAVISLKLVRQRVHLFYCKDCFSATIGVAVPSAYTT